MLGFLGPGKECFVGTRINAFNGSLSVCNENLKVDSVKTLACYVQGCTISLL